MNLIWAYNSGPFPITIDGHLNIYSSSLPLKTIREQYLKSKQGGWLRVQNLSWEMKDTLK